ncbi:MAG: hypothetical protein JO307_23085 [Bryobacterales bacterium]|nr:hypothetical protein [Bryobacterales bacterium]MBV9397408.1 hypothetical protein [Bryobacterales bacterium]
MPSDLHPVEYVERRTDTPHTPVEAHSSGVSWGAVIGGAVVAAAIYLILLALGAGFELSAISPWAGAGLSATALGGAAIAWLFVSEIIASGLGGYLTGRLRTKWTSVHNDEVFFRDTANGFLAWAVALVASAAFLSSAAAMMTGRTAQERAVTEPAAAAVSGPEAYFVDALFRSSRPAPENQDAVVRAEAGRIIANGLRQDQMPPADQNYLAQTIAARTGITQAEAEQRMSDVMTQVRQSADQARKTTARALLWLFVSLLAGAFSASIAATIGGRQRDQVRAA